MYRTLVISPSKEEGLRVFEKLGIPESDVTHWRDYVDQTLEVSLSEEGFPGIAIATYLKKLSAGLQRARRDGTLPQSVLIVRCTQSFENKDSDIWFGHFNVDSAGRAVPEALNFLFDRVFDHHTSENN